MPRCWRPLLSTLFILSLCGCAGEKQGLIWDTFKLSLLGNEAIIDKADLNPAYRYLRVDVNGRSALLVLGYENTTMDKALIQTWYSSNQEVVQLENGRLLGTGGLDTNWTDLVLEGAPSITDPQLFPKDQPVRIKAARNPKFYFFRTRSVMPQFVVNIHEAVVMQGLDEAPPDAPAVLRDPKTHADLKWVQETVVLEPNNPSVHALRAIYAYDKSSRQIIFGRQCLSDQECLSWLSWPFPKKDSDLISSTKKISQESIIANESSLTGEQKDVK